ncbi:hypothetical protein [Acholeplasma laidlawii]|uniref:hypothetical protein n=1 Tax=Acholeplasma laidlawii TaxID=2148 RepID=UPI003F90AF1F
MWYAPGFTSNTIETSFSKVENDITINEYISMHTVVADRYGHEISDIETGMGKIYKSTTFTLDKLKRVKKEVNSKLGTFDYEYIGATNKISKIKKNGTVYKNFNYINNRLRLYNGSLVSYDSYGNIIKLDNQNILYNDRNLMSSHGENSYLYNHNGIRIKKENTNSYSLFYLDGTKILAEYVYSRNGTLEKVYHFYYNAFGIAGVECNGKKYNYLIDGQGNVSKVFFEGRMIGEYFYDSFGNDEINYLFPDNETERQLLRDNPFRWKSYYKDTETGLLMIYINGKTRYYDPSIGQFISRNYDCLNPQAIGGLYLYSLESTFSVSNPLQVTSNHVNILSRLPLISEDDSSGSGKSSPWEWYHWVALGVGTAITIASGGILIAGAVGVRSTGTLVGATVIGAAKGALIGAGIGAATGALGGAIGAGVSGTSGTEFWNMVGQGAVMGFGTGSITGAITGGIQGYNGWFQARALEFTNYGTTNEVVLGRSADNYHLVAQSRNATYFHTTDVRWAQVQAMRGVGTKGIWKNNQVFLNNQIALGRTFYLASQPVKYGFFGKEIAYLMML